MRSVRKDIAAYEGTLEGTRPTNRKRHLTLYQKATKAFTTLNQQHSQPSLTNPLLHHADYLRKTKILLSTKILPHSNSNISHCLNLHVTNLSAFLGRYFPHNTILCSQLKANRINCTNFLRNTSCTRSADCTHLITLKPSAVPSAKKAPETETETLSTLQPQHLTSQVRRSKEEGREREREEGGRGGSDKG